MRRRLEALNTELDATHGLTLQMRIGVNTGEVLAAGDAPPGEPMVTGDVVNVAARLETTPNPARSLAADEPAARFADSASASAGPSRSRAGPTRSWPRPARRIR